MTQDERIQRGWLALTGWQVGMVDTGGQVFGSGEDEEAWLQDAEWSKVLLPALDSPANWGHWESWCTDQGISVEVTQTTLDDWSVGWAVTVGGCSYADGKTRAEALLSALSLAWQEIMVERTTPHHLRDCVTPPPSIPMPPVVLNWWKHKQKYFINMQGEEE